MSLKKHANRHLSLLAGSSLAAGLIGAAGAAFSPSVALAQAVCTPAPSTGAGTNAVTYDAGTYDPGITCTASGGAMSVVTNGAVTLSTTGGVPGDPLVNGINMVGGAQNVILNTAAGTVTAGAQTNGPVIDVTTTSGRIDITTAAVAANVAGTTHAIRATSTGGGAISISRGAGAVNGNAAGGIAGIEAVTNGGSIAITTVGQTSGRLRGILAQTSGAGSVNITAGGGVLVNQADSVAAIDATAGTGGLRILITSGTVNGGFIPSRTAIIGSSTGGGDIDVVDGGIIGRVDFSGVTAGAVLLDTSGFGRWEAAGASVFSNQNDVVTFDGIVMNTLEAGGSIDFSGGADTLNVNTRFTSGGEVRLGAGADVVNVAGLFVANAGAVNFGADSDVLNVSGSFIANGTTLDFGAGQDAFNLSGVLAVNGLTLSGLEAFNHSGTLYLGGTSGTATDDAANDVLRMSSGTFTGSGAGRVVMDAYLDGGAQPGCAVLTGAADCLDLRGASTTGVTTLSLNNLAPDALLAGYDLAGMTLVDVGGGTSASGHFVLDPGSAGYVDDPLYGGVIARPGVFVYALQYDPDTQRHAIVGLPRRGVIEYAVLSGAAQSIWRMTSEAVADRQTDLRNGVGEGSVWVRAAGEYTDREVATSFDTLSETITLDNSYSLYAGAILGGIDLISGVSGGVEYVAGAQIGYVGSSFELNEGSSSGQFTGATGGVYASAWSEWFFADGAVSLNGLTLNHEQPGLRAKTNTFVNSIGAAAEAGIRTRLTERTFAEPLFAASWARTSFEEISLNGGEVQPADAESLRAALGLRLGATLAGDDISATWFVTGRAWHEFEGETRGVVHNLGTDLPLSDELTGAFGEAELGLNIYNAANTLSGFLTSGVKWKDGYSAVNLSLGARMAW